MIRHIEQQQLNEVTVHPVYYEVVFSILADLRIRVRPLCVLALLVEPGRVGSRSSEGYLATRVLSHQTIMLL